MNTCVQRPSRTLGSGHVIVVIVSATPGSVSTLTEKPIDEERDLSSMTAHSIVCSCVCHKRAVFCVLTLTVALWLTCGNKCMCENAGQRTWYRHHLGLRTSHHMLEVNASRRRPRHLVAVHVVSSLSLFYFRVPRRPALLSWSATTYQSTLSVTLSVSHSCLCSNFFKSYFYILILLNLADDISIIVSIQVKRTIWWNGPLQQFNQ